jgi:hypothetical protein
MASRSSTGREMIARQWANAEFTALCQLYEAGVPVPYPVQVLGTEVLLELIGEPDGTAAPRLAETRPRVRELAGLWDQLVAAPGPPAPRPPAPGLPPRTWPRCCGRKHAAGLGWDKPRDRQDLGNRRDVL